MSSEVLFFVFLGVNLILPIIFLKGGKAWLYGYIGINCALLLPIGPLETEVFGYTIGLMTIVWAPIFLCTDILTEKYGKKAAVQGALLSASTGYVVILIMQLMLAFEPSTGSQEWHTLLSDVYQYSIRMVFVGTVVFMSCQFIDIYVYDYLHKKTGEKYLWLRNNASTFFSSFINNILFWWLAFGHVLDSWLATAIASYLLTITVATFDTPFIYLAKRITPLDLKKKQ